MTLTAQETRDQAQQQLDDRVRTIVRRRSYDSVSELEVGHVDDEFCVSGRVHSFYALQLILTAVDAVFAALAPHHCRYVRVSVCVCSSQNTFRAVCERR